MRKSCFTSRELRGGPVLDFLTQPPPQIPTTILSAIVTKHVSISPIFHPVTLRPEIQHMRAVFEDCFQGYPRWVIHGLPRAEAARRRMLTAIHRDEENHTRFEAMIAKLDEKRWLLGFVLATGAIFVTAMTLFFMTFKERPAPRIAVAYAGSTFIYLFRSTATLVKQYGGTIEPKDLSTAATLSALATCAMTLPALALGVPQARREGDVLTVAFGVIGGVLLPVYGCIVWVRRWRNVGCK